MPEQTKTREAVNGKGRAEGALAAKFETGTSATQEDRNSFAEAVVRTARDPLLILNVRLEVEVANEAFYSTFKVNRAESIGRSVFDLDHHHWDIPKLRELLEDILPRHSFFNDFEVTHNFEHIGKRTMLLNARTLKDATGADQRVLLGIQDVTELLHFQAEMRHSELRYRRLFEASRDGVLLVNPETRKIMDANPFMSELLGYSHKELVGKELFEIGLLKDEAASQAAFKELQKKGYIRYENLPLETQNNQRREVEFVSNLYREGSAKIIQCNVRDVTERKKAERELAEKARLLDLSEDAIVVSDLGGAISLWNRGAEKVFGWPASEAMGKRLHVLLQTEFSKPIDEILAEVARTGQYSGELAQVARDGRRVPLLCRWVLDRSTNSILATYTDITNVRQMKNELRQSEQRYRKLFEAIDEGFCVIEMIFDESGLAADYRFLETNPSFEKHTGFVGLGKRMREISPDHEDYWFETFGNVARTQESTRFVYEAQNLGRWFDVFAFPAGAEQRQVAILFRDITEHMNAQVALQENYLKSVDRASELEQAVANRTGEVTAGCQQMEDFLYSIAHDLRAPLRAMEGYSAALVEEAKENLSKTCQDFAFRIGVSARFMDALLRDLIALSGIAQQSVDLKPVNLERVVDLAVSCLQKEIGQKWARIEIEGPWSYVLAHEATIGPVISHLLENALKFVAAGVIPAIRIRTEEKGKVVRLWIEDNGIGIDPAYFNEVFRMFRRLNADAYSGTGIGLAIVKKGINRMAGQCGVASIPGKGSQFWIELPKASAPKPSTPISL